MSKTILNDKTYSFKPLKVYVPSDDYEVDEAELQKSIQKSKEIFSRLNKYWDWKKQP